MRVYVETSALIKTFRVEAETSALAAYLTRVVKAEDSLVTSVLTVIEAERSLRRLSKDHAIALTQEPGIIVNRAMQGITELAITQQVARFARWVGQPTLRSLDAIHLATALLSEADVMVTYDNRLADAATASNIQTIAPN